MMVIILQYINVSNKHFVYLKSAQYYVSIISFSFLFFFATPRSLRDLSFPTGGRTQAPSSESMESPSPKHWTAREFPIISKKKYIFQKIMFVKVPSRVSGINIISFPFLN